MTLKNAALLALIGTILMTAGALLTDDSKRQTIPVMEEHHLDPTMVSRAQGVYSVSLPGTPWAVWWSFGVRKTFSATIQTAYASLPMEGHGTPLLDNQVMIRDGADVGSDAGGTGEI